MFGVLKWKFFISFFSPPVYHNPTLFMALFLTDRNGLCPGVLTERPFSLGRSVFVT